MLGDDPLVRREEVARPSLARPVWVKRTPTPEKAPRAVPSLLPMSPLAGERQAAAFDAAASAGAASASFAPSSDTPSLGGKKKLKSKKIKIPNGPPPAQKKDKGPKRKEGRGLLGRLFSPGGVLLVAAAGGVANLIRQLQDELRAGSDDDDEADTRRSSPRANLNLETTEHPTFVLNAEGKVVLWNSKAAAITGRSAKEMLGKPLATKFSDPSMKEALRAAIDRMMAGHPPGELDVQFATHAGADVSCSLMMAIPGNVSVRKRVRVVGVMISITVGEAKDPLALERESFVAVEKQAAAEAAAAAAAEAAEAAAAAAAAAKNAEAQREAQMLAEAEAMARMLEAQQRAADEAAAAAAAKEQQQQQQAEEQAILAATEAAAVEKEAGVTWRAFLAQTKTKRANDEEEGRGPTMAGRMEKTAEKTTMRMLANQRYVTESKFKGKKDIVLNAVYGSVDEIFSRMEEYRKERRWRLTEMFFEVDKKRDGVLVMSELIRFVSQIVPDFNPGQLRRFHQYLDRDSSGTISYKELSTGLKRSKATGELRRNRSLKYIGLILNTLGEAPFETLSAWPWRNGFLSLAGLHAQLQELLAAYDEEVLEETMDEVVPILQQFGHVALQDLVGVLKAISLYGN